jgi:carbonic anhydrase
MKQEIMKAVLDNLKFVDAKSKDYVAIVKGQTPKITLITCSDSRVPPHSISSDTVNHVFCIENMGNQLKTAEGTVDYGVLHLHTPVLVVLGHTNCGAVNASLTNYTGEPATIIKELATISDGYRKTKAAFGEDSKKADRYAEKNVDFQVKLAVDKYSDLIKAGKLNVVGMMFDFADTYGSKKGHVYVTNVNGETDIDRIKESEIVKGTDAIVKRVTA